MILLLCSGDRRNYYVNIACHNVAFVHFWDYICFLGRKVSSGGALRRYIMSLVCNQCTVNLCDVTIRLNHTL
jgi:hypothetical protein